MKEIIYVLFEHDNEGKEPIRAYRVGIEADKEAARLEQKKWDDGYKGYGGKGYHVEAIEFVDAGFV